MPSISSSQSWYSLFQSLAQPAHVHNRLSLHSDSQVAQWLKTVTAVVFFMIFFLFFFHQLQFPFLVPFLFPGEVTVSTTWHQGWFPTSEGDDKAIFWWCLQGMKCANAMQITLMKQPNVLGLCPRNIPLTWLWCISFISSSQRPNHLKIYPFSSCPVLWHSWSWLKSRGQYLA